MRVVSVKMEYDLVAKLDSYAIRRKKTRSEVIRELVEQLVMDDSEDGKTSDVFHIDMGYRSDQNKLFKCKICGGEFRTNSGILRHLRRGHAMWHNLREYYETADLNGKV